MVPKSARKKIIIVGNGLFGSIAASHCRLLGYEVTVVSNDRPGSASKASGCVIAPSWLTALPKERISEGAEVLKSLYKVHDITFQSNLMRPFQAQRVDLDSVIVQPDVACAVREVGDGKVVLQDGSILRGKVLVAAGIWSAELVPTPSMKALWGAAIHFKASNQPSKINVYAPYRQAVLFQATKNKAWMGDGSALIQKTWDKESLQRTAATIDRGRAMLHLASTATAVVIAGARPYVEGYKGGYFARVHPSTWVSTGGAKNGTLLAALQAKMFSASLA